MVSAVLQSRHQSAIRCLSWSPDGRLLASADNEGVVKVWIADGILISSFQAFALPANTVRFLDAERLVVGAARGALATTRLLMEERLSWFGDTLWFGSPPSPTLRVFSLDGRLLSEAEDFTEDVTDIAVSKSHMKIITTGTEALLWDFDLRFDSALWDTLRAVSVDITGDGNEIAVCMTDDWY